jgi:FAD/FMN-containing dehydrogenase
MDGIQLYVRAFNGVVVDAERNIATVGGGVIGSEFISALSAAGKRSGGFFKMFYSFLFLTDRMA